MWNDHTKKKSLSAKGAKNVAVSRIGMGGRGNFASGNHFSGKMSKIAQNKQKIGFEENLQTFHVVGEFQQISRIPRFLAF